MNFFGVQLPLEVVKALAEDRLVLFAGAGVSYPAPANLPLFSKLAADIGQVTKVPEGKREDEYLGDLKRRGVDVHITAAKILLDKQSAPADLHMEMMKLFRKPEQVRIVTTNFDPHFSTASEKVFKRGAVREYSSPALPLGDDFEGLVYLHGAAAESPRNLILTDEDFGAAYLTRGWVRQFLIPLFRRYVVAFIGYSHGDITMTYLARGLPSYEACRRFVFLRDDPDAKANGLWGGLGIDVIRYPKADNGEANSHQRLTDCFREWASHSRTTKTAEIRQLRTLVRGLPPEGNSDVGLLHHWLNDERMCKEFCKAVKKQEWLSWLKSNGYFECLFDRPSLKFNDRDRVILSFAAGKWRKRFSGFLLQFIINEQGGLSDRLVAELARDMAYDNSKKMAPHFTIWLSLLISHSRKSRRIDPQSWCLIITKLRIPEHSAFALELIERVTTPTINLEQSRLWGMIEKDSNEHRPTSFRPELLNSEPVWNESCCHLFKKVIESLVPKQLKFLGRELCILATHQLHRASALCTAVSPKHTPFALSLRRPYIAVHEDNRIRRNMAGLLIDLARDTLEYLVGHESAWTASHLEWLWGTKLPLFQRICVHIRDVDQHTTSDEKIDFVIQNRLLFQSNVKTEVFRILASSYPTASSRSQRKLLNKIAIRYQKRDTDSRVSAYEVFNLLTWLHTHDDQCPELEALLIQVKSDNPAFRPRERPELDFYTSSKWVDPTEGEDFKAITEAAPQDYLDRILATPKLGAPKDREDICRLLKSLFEQNREWGLKFLSLAGNEKNLDKESWNEILYSCQTLLQSAKDWETFVPVLKCLKENENSLEGLVWLIDHQLWKCDELGVDDEAVVECMDVLKTVWDSRVDRDSGAVADFRNWYESAINHLGGWIGESWIRYCFLLKNNDRDPLPDQLRQQITEAVSSDDPVAAYARIAITPFVAYLYLWDRKFFRANLLKLFDWEQDPAIAQQTWSVMLNFSRGSAKELEKELLESYETCATEMAKSAVNTGERLTQFDSDTQRRFGSHIARLAVHVIPDADRAEFLTTYTRMLTGDARDGLIRGIVAELEEQDPVNRLASWRKWFAPYLEQRAVGRPASLSTTETRSLLPLAILLQDLFPCFVELLAKVPLADLDAYGTSISLSETDFAEKYPDSTCHLLSMVLRHSDEYYIPTETAKMLERLRSVGASTEALTELENELIQKGWSP